MKEKILHISRVFDNQTKANTYARLPISNHSINVKLCIVSFHFVMYGILITSIMFILNSIDVSSQDFK